MNSKLKIEKLILIKAELAFKNPNSIKIALQLLFFQLDREYIAERLKINRRKVFYLLSELEQIGIIEKFYAGSINLYRIKKNLKDKIIDIIANSASQHIRNVRRIPMCNKTFLTDNPKIEGRLMQLAHSFTIAVAEENEKLARDICKEAIKLKKE